MSPIHPSIYLSIYPGASDSERAPLVGQEQASRSGPAADGAALEAGPRGERYYQAIIDAANRWEIDR